MDSPRVCRRKRSQPPGKSKHHFSPFRYVFLLMWGGGLYHCLEALLLLFLYVGAFLLRFSPNVVFHHVGTIFVTFFSMWWAFLFSCGAFMGLHSPMKLFADACNYVTYIPCPLPSLTAAIVFPTKPTATPVFNSQ